MGGLTPLPEGLSREERQLSEALRTLFEGLGVSVRRYAARRHRDPGSLSRYFNGSRIPPWEFVIDLLTDISEHLGKPPTPMAVSRLRELHRAALEASKAPQHVIQALRDKLGEADRDARTSALQQQVLMEALTDRRHRIADLQVQLNQSEASRIESDLRASKELTLREEELDRMRAEKEALEFTVAQLEEQLIETQRRHAEAETRCELLERELESAESANLTHNSTPSDYSGAPFTGRAKILITDDDRTNADRIENILAPIEQDVLIAPSGTSALEIIENNSDIAVILISHPLDGGDGAYSLTSQIKQGNGKDIPVIFLGVPQDEPHSTFRIYAAGAVDAIDQPVDPWVLRAKVAVFVELYWKTVLAQESAALINAMSQNSAED